MKRTAEHHRSGGKRLLLLKMRLSCETAGERGDAGIHQPSFISSVRLLRLTPSNFTGFKLCSTSANTSTCLFCSARNASVTPPEPQTHTNQKRTRLLLFLQHRGYIALTWQVTGPPCQKVERWWCNRWVCVFTPVSVEPRDLDSLQTVCRHLNSTFLNFEREV